MRYLIVLLVVLSFAASFGSYELESARIVDAGRFGVTAGGVLTPAWLYIGFVAARLGVEYGLSDNFSLGLKGDFSYGEGVRNSLLNFSLSLKTNIAFFDLPISLGLSLGGELNNYSAYRYHPTYHETYLSIKSNLTFQAWFVYLGLTYNIVDVSCLPTSVDLGFDIEFTDSFSLLTEVGASFTRPYADVGPGGHYHWPYLAIGVEAVF